MKLMNTPRSRLVLMTPWAYSAIFFSNTGMDSFHWIWMLP